MGWSTAGSRLSRAMAVKRFRQTTPRAVVLVHVTVLTSFALAAFLYATIWLVWAGFVPAAPEYFSETRQTETADLASLNRKEFAVVAGLYALWVVLSWRGRLNDTSGTGVAWAALGVLCHAFVDSFRALVIDNALSRAASGLGTVAFFSGLALFGWHLWTHRHVQRHGSDRKTTGVPRSPASLRRGGFLQPSRGRLLEAGTSCQRRPRHRTLAALDSPASP